MANRQQQQLDFLTFLKKLLFCARGKLARKIVAIIAPAFPMFLDNYLRAFMAKPNYQFIYVYKFLSPFLF